VLSAHEIHQLVGEILTRDQEDQFGMSKKSTSRTEAKTSADFAATTSRTSADRRQSFDESRASCHASMSSACRKSSSRSPTFAAGWFW
jgi:hypothetical protein